MEYSYTSIVRVGVITVVAVFILATAFICIKIFMGYLKRKLYIIKRSFKILLTKLQLTFQIFKSINKHFYSHTVEVVFQLYIFFYEKNYKELEDSFGFDLELFPREKRDLMEMYKWITKTRHENYDQLLQLDYDVKKKQFTFWGSHYQGLKYKITDEGELKIIPLETIETEHPYTIFQHRVNNMYEDLFKLDTSKCEWVLERRKYFMI